MKLKKLWAVALSTTMLLGSALTANAADYTTDGNATIPISATIESSYTLSLPASLTMEADSNGAAVLDVPLSVTMNVQANKALCIKDANDYATAYILQDTDADTAAAAIKNIPISNGTQTAYAMAPCHCMIVPNNSSISTTIYNNYYEAYDAVTHPLSTAHGATAADMPCTNGPFSTNFCGTITKLPASNTMSASITYNVGILASTGTITQLDQFPAGNYSGNLVLTWGLYDVTE